MKIRKELLWDYDPNAIPKGEVFDRFYISRVLTRGSDADIKDIGKEKIRALLPKLNLAPAVRGFWEWYFEGGNRSGTSFSPAARNTPESQSNRD